MSRKEIPDAGDKLGVVRAGGFEMGITKRTVPHVGIIRCWPWAHVRLGKSKHHEQDCGPGRCILTIVHLPLGLIQLVKPSLYGLLVQEPVNGDGKIKVPLNEARSITSRQHHIQRRVKVRRLGLQGVEIGQGSIAKGEDGGPLRERHKLV